MLGGGDHHGIAGDQGDVGEILDRIVGQRLGDSRTGGESAGQHADRVAVGLGFCDCVPRCHPRGGGILDHHGLAEPLAELLSEQPAHEIGAAARRGSGHDPQRARRPLLGRKRGRRHGGKRNGEQAREYSHYTGYCLMEVK